jgi:hypothetical protein
VSEPTPPFAVISQGLLEVHAGLETFSLANKRGIKQGFYRDCWIVDVNGETYGVDSFDVVSEPFWRRPKIPGLGRAFRLVNFVFRPLGSVQTSEVVARVRDSMKASPSYWEARGDVDVVEQRLLTAETVRDVIGVLLAP